MKGSKIAIPLAKPDENLSIGGQILLNVRTLARRCSANLGHPADV
jgi:hypothetical protein